MRLAAVATLKHDLAARHPEAIEEIRRLAAAHARTLTPVENQITRGLPK